MAESRGRDSWAHTSSVLAMIANVNRDPKKGRVFRPDDFNPYAGGPKTSVPITTNSIGLLKTVFVNNTERNGK